MAVLTPLSVDQLAGLVGQWEVGALIGHEAAEGGIENTNYFVTTEGTDGVQGRYVLTVLERFGAQTEPLSRVMQGCEDAGLPVRAPRRSRAPVHWLGRPVVLCPWLPGAHPARADPVQCAAIGRFLARLHRVHASTGGVPPHPRDAAWFQRESDLLGPTLSWIERVALRDAVRTVAALSRRREYLALPRGVVHADLFRDNALFIGPVLTGVIDFHHVAFAPLALDIAVCLNDWCTNDAGALEPVAAAALLSAYQRLRPLAPFEWLLLPVLRHVAACAFWVSRLHGRSFPARPGAPGKPPEEMARIARHAWPVAEPLPASYRAQ